MAILIFFQNYKVSVAEGFPSQEANEVLFAMVAKTKGDFALVICSVISYADIDEHRLYTYDFNGNVIDSILIQHYFVTVNGQVLMPLTGALMGNLDVVTCEIKWKGEISPYHPSDWNLIDGKQEGQRVDSYYTNDETGHFVLKTQVKYYSQTYTEDDVSTLNLRSKDDKRKTIFTPMSSADVEEVIEY